MGKSQYRIGIAGCGKVARLHAAAIKEIANARLIGAWSRNPESAAAFAKEYDLATEATVAELVKRHAIDLLIVCTPHPFHLEPAIEAANAGAHVLVEKPLASCLEHCDRIIETCRQQGVKLGVVSQRRWYQPAIRVRQAIEQGKIDRPVLATVALHGWRDHAYYEADAWRGTWEQEGGGVLVNQAPHMLDLLLWYMGEVDEVFGIWSNLNHPSIEVEDTALSVIKFKSGAIGSIIASNSQNPGLHGRVHVYGSSGASIGAQTEGGSMFIAGSTSIQEPPYNNLWTIPGETELAERWKNEDTEFFSSIDPTLHYIGLQISDFIEAIERDREPAVSGQSGRAVVELFTAIYRSNRANRPIRFPLPPASPGDTLDGRIP